MARFIGSLSVLIDPADVAAFAADIEAILLRYGDEPQPHNRTAFNREMARAESVLVDCMLVVFDPR